MLCKGDTSARKARPCIAPHTVFLIVTLCACIFTMACVHAHSGSLLPPDPDKEREARRITGGKPPQGLGSPAGRSVVAQGAHWRSPHPCATHCAHSQDSTHEKPDALAQGCFTLPTQLYSNTTGKKGKRKRRKKGKKTKHKKNPTADTVVQLCVEAEFFLLGAQSPHPNPSMHRCSQ